MPPPSLRHLDAPASSVGSGSSSLRGRRNRAGRPLLNRLNTATGPFPRPLKPGSLSPDSLLSVFCSSDSSTPSLQWEATVRVPAPIQLQSSASVQSPVIPGRRSRWDDLEASVCALDASDNQGAFGDSAYDLFRLLESEILATRKTYRKFLQYRGLMAQLLIDTLQWVRPEFILKSITTLTHWSRYFDSTRHLTVAREGSLCKLLFGLQSARRCSPGVIFSKASPSVKSCSKPQV